MWILNIKITLLLIIFCFCRSGLCSAECKEERCKYYPEFAAFPQLWQTVEDRISYQCAVSANLALLKKGVKATASTVEEKGGQGKVEYLIDDNDDTYWMSSYMKEVGKPAKITITFPSAVTFNCVHWWYQKEGEGDVNRKPKDYDIKVSKDGKNWKDILKVRNNRLGNRYDTFSPVKGKFLTITILKCERLNRGRPLLYGLEVYNLCSVAQDSNWADKDRDYRVNLPVGRGREKGWYVYFNELLNDPDRKIKDGSLKVFQTINTGSSIRFVPVEHTFTEGPVQGEGVLKIKSLVGKNNVYAYFNVEPIHVKSTKNIEMVTNLKRKNYVWEEDITLLLAIHNNYGRTITGDVSCLLVENGAVFEKMTIPVELISGKENNVNFKLRIPMLAPGDYELRFQLQTQDSGLYESLNTIGIWQPLRVAFPFGVYTIKANSLGMAAKHLKTLADHNISCIPGYRNVKHKAWRYIMDECIKYRMGTIAYSHVYSASAKNKQNKLTCSSEKTFKGIYNKPYEGDASCFADRKELDNASLRIQSDVKNCLLYPSFLEKVVVNDDVHMGHARPNLKIGGKSYPDLSCYCENCRHRFMRLTGHRKLPKPWEVIAGSPIIPDNDIWLDFCKFRCGKVYNEFNKRIVNEKNKVSSGVQIGGVTGSSRPVFEPILGHYPPLDKLDVVSSYCYPMWSHPTLDHITIGEYSAMGNRSKPVWMLGGMFAEWRMSDVDVAVIDEGETDNTSIWPGRWRVFGHFGRGVPVPIEVTSGLLPNSLTVNGKNVSPKTICNSHSQINFGKIFKEHQVGWTGYAFSELDLPEEKEISIGFGADWWAQWWVDGKQVYDTLKKGNKEPSITVTNHVFKVHLSKGKHIIAVRVISGSASWRIVFGDDMVIEKQKKLDLEKRKVYYAPEGYIRNSSWMMLAGGNKLIWFFTYGKGVPPGSYSMCEMKEVGAIFRKYGDLFAKMHSPHKKVAVLASFTQSVYEAINANKIGKYHYSQRRLANKLLNYNIPFEFVSEEEIKNKYLEKGTDILVISRQSRLTRSVFDSINLFIKQGGKVIVTEDVDISFPKAYKTSLNKLPEKIIELLSETLRITGKELIVREMIAGNDNILITVAKDYRTSVDSKLCINNMAGYAYDIVSQKYLGKVPNEFNVKLKQGGGTVIAIIPDRIKRLTMGRVDVPEANEKIYFKCEVKGVASELVKADIPIWIDLFNPQGQQVARSFSVLAEDGICKISVPLCSNDSCGEWVVKATELFSGKSTEQVIKK